MTDQGVDVRPVELDYVFLAQWAGVQPGNLLTAVGVGFLRVHATPMLSFAVAGRLRMYDDTPPTSLKIEITSPDESKLVVTDTMAPGNEDMKYAADRWQSLFSLVTQIPMADPGMCVVDVFLDDRLVRSLKFEVVAEEHAAEVL